MSSSTWRQQEERIVEHLPEFYLTHLGHAPSQVWCRVADSQMVMTIEGAITQPEKLLLITNQTPLVLKFRQGLDQVLQIKLSLWIAQLFQVEIVDLFLNTDITHDRTTVLATFTQSQVLDGNDGDRSQST